MELRAAQRVSLPVGEVRILQMQRRKRRRLTRKKCVVDSHQLRQENAIDGEAVKNNVVQEKIKAILFLAQPHQHGSQQLPAFHIERQSGLLACQTQRLRLALGWG